MLLDYHNWAIISKNEADIAKNEAIHEKNRADYQKENARESFHNAVETADAVGVNLLDYIQGDMAVPTESVIKLINIADSSYQKLYSQGDTTGQIKLRQVRFLSQAAEVFYQIGYIKEGLANAQHSFELFTNLKKLTQDTLDIVYAGVLYPRGKGFFESGKF